MGGDLCTDTLNRDDTHVSRFRYGVFCHLTHLQTYDTKLLLSFIRGSPPTSPGTGEGVINGTLLYVRTFERFTIFRGTSHPKFDSCESKTLP